MSEQNNVGPDIDRLINDLSEEGVTKASLYSPVMRFGLWAVLTGLYHAMALFIEPLRYDMHVLMVDPVTILELSLGLAVFGFSALAATHLCIPDMAQRNWLFWASIASGTALFIVNLARGFMTGFGWNLIHWDHCITSAITFGLVPALFLVFLTQKGATTRPYRMVFMNLFSVCGLGYVALRVTCSVDVVAHSFFAHLLPFAIFGVALFSIARRLYKW